MFNQKWINVQNNAYAVKLQWYAESSGTPATNIITYATLKEIPPLRVAKALFLNCIVDALGACIQTSNPAIQRQLKTQISLITKPDEPTLLEEGEIFFPELYKISKEIQSKLSSASVDMSTSALALRARKLIEEQAPSALLGELVVEAIVSDPKTNKLVNSQEFKRFYQRYTKTIIKLKQKSPPASENGQIVANTTITTGRFGPTTGDHYRGYGRTDRISNPIIKAIREELMNWLIVTRIHERFERRQLNPDKKILSIDTLHGIHDTDLSKARNVLSFAEHVFTLTNEAPDNNVQFQSIELFRKYATLPQARRMVPENVLTQILELHQALGATEEMVSFAGNKTSAFDYWSTEIRGANSWTLNSYRVLSNAFFPKAISADLKHEQVRKLLSPLSLYDLEMLRHFLEKTSVPPELKGGLEKNAAIFSRIRTSVTHQMESHISFEDAILLIKGEIIEAGSNLLNDLTESELAHAAMVILKEIPFNLTRIDSAGAESALNDWLANKLTPKFVKDNLRSWITHMRKHDQ